MASAEKPEPAVPESLPTSLAAAQRGSRFGQAMGRVIPRHWGTILGLWLVLTTGVIVAINKWVRPSYESSALIRVEPANRDLFNLQNSAEAFGPFLQTQAELIRSANVLSAAMTDDKVLRTTLVRGAKDPESEIRRRLEVRIVPGTYLIRVALTSLDPEDAPVIVNKVIATYIDVASDWAGRKNNYQFIRLKDYRDQLNEKIEQQMRVCSSLADPPIIDLPLPGSKRNQISLEEYQRIRDRLFETNLKLIESEAFLEHRKGQLGLLEAGADPELLTQKRIKDALRKDPAIASLMSEIDLHQRKVDMANYRASNATDASVVQPSRKMEALRADLRDLIAQKQEELAARHVDGDPRLHELTEQIDLLKVQKSTYEKLLSQLQVTDRKDGSNAARIALAREDLTSLREMRASVEKRLEQLDFDSRGEARIQQIEAAKETGIPVKDARRNLWLITPLAVLALVMGMFLIVEIQSARVAEHDEKPRQKPVSDQDEIR